MSPYNHTCDIPTKASRLAEILISLYAKDGSKLSDGLSQFVYRLEQVVRQDSKLASIIIPSPHRLAVSKQGPKLSGGQSHAQFGV